MMEIIPAIDIIDGKCVRLSQGDYMRKKIYNENPLEVAKQFEEAGIRRLHLVDLDGAKKGAVVNQKVLESIAQKTKLIIDFGGGIKTEEEMRSVFNAGANMVAVGSVAVKNTALFFTWVKKFGAEKFLLGADVKNEKIAVGGWTEQTTISVFDFIKQNVAEGMKNIFCTDISKDGMLQGASAVLYKNITRQFPEIDLIASGGISSLKDIEECEKAGCKGAIIGKAIYEGNIFLSDLKRYLC
ncbi:MAG TPA: 1-(5-phosphoribosyl)-5-[(5-phosphoribosylamino)methylideneamino]imidazole-4-carboxamide isomerase [Bacteroidia bacterium]